MLESLENDKLVRVICILYTMAFWIVFEITYTLYEISIY